MALRVPTGISNLLAQIKTYRWSMLGLGVLGAVVVLRLWPGAVPHAMPPPVVERAPTMRAVTTPRDGLEAQMNQFATTLSQSDKTMQAIQRTLEAQARKDEERDRAQREAQVTQAERDAARQRQFEDVLARAKQTPAATSTPAVTKTTSAVRQPVTLPSPPPSLGFELRTLRPDAQSKRVSPPLANEAETAYLPIGCHVAVRVVTGVMATSQVNGGAWGSPVLLVLTRAFNCPWNLPDLRDRLHLTPSHVPLDGCFAIGKAVADMSSSRAHIAVEYLSCVFPDGSSFEPSVEGWVVDQDGTEGLVGEVQTHESAKVMKAFLVGLIQEASTAFGLAKAQVLVTGTSGIQPFQGAQSTLQMVASLWLEQARALLPTLWVRANTPAYVVLRKGVPLKGYPVVALLGRGL